MHSVVNASSVEEHDRKTLIVAVSSNFSPTMALLAIEFEKRTGHTLKLSSGSSGKHYAQIKQGAPFDVFFSADKKRPELLEKKNIAVRNTRFTYALGRLVLIGYDTNLVSKKINAFSDPDLQRLSIANPRLAPYGAAAEQILTAMDVFEPLKRKIVRGENVNQAFQFVVSGNAQLGLVSYAQIVRGEQDNFWLIPSDLHDAIEQQAVIIKDSQAARVLIEFIRSDVALNIIKQQGYDVP